MVCFSRPITSLGCEVDKAALAWANRVKSALNKLPFLPGLSSKSLALTDFTFGEFNWMDFKGDFFKGDAFIGEFFTGEFKGKFFKGEFFNGEFFNGDAGVLFFKGDGETPLKSALVASVTFAFALEGLFFFTSVAGAELELSSVVKTFFFGVASEEDLSLL